MKLIEAVYNKLFGTDESNFAVVWNPDKFLFQKDVRNAIQDMYHIKIYSGNSLDLRIIRETVFKRENDKILFLKDSDFEILEDVAQDIYALSFNLKALYPAYCPWNRIKDFSFAELCLQYEDNSYVYTKDNAYCHQLQESSVYGSNKLEELEIQWNLLKLKGFDFNNPGVWISKASDLILSAIKYNCWDDFKVHIDEINDDFQEFLKSGYINIVSSTCGSKRPRIVTHVLPFINKQKDTKTALIVVDGMNFWQGILLGTAIKQNTAASVKYNSIYSWLPSVTELARQAIFRGDSPNMDYVQNPSNEKKLWNSFWDKTGLPKHEYYYQHNGLIKEGLSVRRLGYVTVDLDEMMHASSNYLYLYDSTKRWVEEENVQTNIQYLLENGYRIYVTTDHGNIETEPYKKLDQRDKIGADISRRHIILPDEADKTIFETQYFGHLTQIDSESKQYYAKGREAFYSDKCVTHGGTHWLEVLIPFITIEKE